ncbi:hypothetical protein GCM10009641_61800 [Mycobacterium cookii]|uniref:Uncharacterized protein n=1 Tax=Nocardioides furvisabuli TaxID=375542 RepID=A0ABN2XAT8_9ACTN|nr:hypothetical protein [Nocardioides furvisabuli]
MAGARNLADVSGLVYGISALTLVRESLLWLNEASSHPGRPDFDSIVAAGAPGSQPPDKHLLHSDVTDALLYTKDDRGLLRNPHLDSTGSGALLAHPGDERV